MNFQQLRSIREAVRRQFNQSPGAGLRSMASVTGRNSLTSAANSKLLTSATNEIAHPNLAVIVTSPLEHDTQRLRGTENS